MADKSNDFRTGRHVVYNLHAHIVLMTKYRKNAITDRVREHLIAVTTQVCQRHGVTLVKADAEHDYLHLEIDYPPTASISRLIGAIKTNTSREVRATGWPEANQGPVFWSPSYFATSTGTAPLERVAAYVHDQRQPNKPVGHPPKPKRNPAP